jgi:gas vesicle protein
MFGSSRDRDSSTAQGFGLGLLVGAVIGAGAALLLAPSSGAETRKRLRREARRAYIKGADTAEDLWDETERTARRLAKRGMNRSREALNNL